MFTNNSRIIFLNRFLSLIIEYGYAIALSIIFSKISVDYVLGLWIAKFLGGILANVGHQFVGKITNKKYVLIGIELLKAVCLALIYLAMGSVFVFALVVLTEVLTTYFNSLLSSAVPVLVKKANLQKFNSTYTMIGSASYFLAPAGAGRAFAGHRGHPGAAHRGRHAGKPHPVSSAGRHLSGHQLHGPLRRGREILCRRFCY